MAALMHLDGDAARALGNTPEALLRALSGPALIRIPGRDRSRARAVSVLLHGNEPSGLVALQRLLRDRVVPAVDLLCSVGAVEAARAEPRWSRRMLPGRRDLNRCFVAPPDDIDGDIARGILEGLAGAPLECAADLHNNTGDNPSYGVITSDTAATRSLVALFTRTCVATDLRLGTYMEAVGSRCPTVTIECGRAGTPGADTAATRGLRAFAELEHLDPTLGDSLTMYDCDKRVQLKDGVALDFGVSATDAAEVTLRSDLERYNFTVVPAGELLGWVRGAAVPLEVVDLGGRHTGDDLFAVDRGKLLARRDLLPAMMTTDIDVVQADCLCYLMRRR